ncbi:hypothetical protein TUBRATIS_29840 [Tubulinosema ratisbonensis]|uniref:Uncharacterized protein n=1 Tax=Tubulinosema ratisbonensis TaxID=291195 RepID=A0A437AHF2_9MICR|nr:hypothetical protein TUBRATIS_29840 [Tubulinosema ratisbonensis]
MIKAKLLLFISCFTCSHKNLSIIIKPLNQKEGCKFEQSSDFLDWVHRKFFEINNNEHNNIFYKSRIKFYSNYDYNNLLEQICKIYVSQISFMPNLVIVKVLMEYYCFYFFQSHLIYNRMYHKSFRGIIFLYNLFENKQLNIFFDFTKVYAGEYLQEKDALFKKKDEYYLNTTIYLRQKDFETDFRICTLNILSKLNINYKRIHGNCDFINFMNQKSMLKLLLDIYNDIDFKKLKTLLPELQIIKKYSLKTGTIYLNLQKIYYCLMIIMTKFKVINILTFKNEDSIFYQKYIPLYKIKIITLLKFSIRCYQFCLYRILEDCDNLNLDFIQILASLSYYKIDSNINIVDENDTEAVLARDYANHMNVNYIPAEKR